MEGRKRDDGSQRRGHHGHQATQGQGARQVGHDRQVRPLRRHPTRITEIYDKGNIVHTLFSLNRVHHETFATHFFFNHSPSGPL